MEGGSLERENRDFFYQVTLVVEAKEALAQSGSSVIDCGSRQARSASRSKPRRATQARASANGPVGVVDESATAPGGIFFGPQWWHEVARRRGGAPLGRARR